VKTAVAKGGCEAEDLGAEHQVPRQGGGRFEAGGHVPKHDAGRRGHGKVAEVCAPAIGSHGPVAQGPSIKSRYLAAVQVPWFRFFQEASPTHLLRITAQEEAGAQ
jgi:hypothetical protein